MRLLPALLALTLTATAATGALAGQKASATQAEKAAVEAQVTATDKAAENSGAGFFSKIFDPANRGYAATQWRGNWQGGRKFAPAGR
ncbi:MAG: hypothetical protein AAF416_16215 [Pseudomonadota bacterium]